MKHKEGHGEEKYKPVWRAFSYAFLGRVSNRIGGGVRGAGRVAYDVSSKPPATIEWE